MTCLDCDSPPVPGKSRCQLCQGRLSQLARRLRQARVAAGLCPRCGQPVASRQRSLDQNGAEQPNGPTSASGQQNPGRQLCEYHAKRQTALTQQRRARRKAEQEAPG